jgi:hypothetical protein
VCVCVCVCVCVLCVRASLTLLHLFRYEEITSTTSKVAKETDQSLRRKDNMIATTKTRVQDLEAQRDKALADLQVVCMCVCMCVWCL